LAQKQLSGAGYATLENDLLGFESIGHLLRHIFLHALNDGSGIANAYTTIDMHVFYARWWPKPRLFVHVAHSDLLKTTSCLLRVTTFAGLT